MYKGKTRFVEGEEGKPWMNGPDHLQTIRCICPIHYGLSSNGLSRFPRGRPAFNHKSQVAVKDFDKTSSLCVELCVVEASLVYWVNIDLDELCNCCRRRSNKIVDIVDIDIVDIADIDIVAEVENWHFHLTDVNISIFVCFACHDLCEYFLYI